MKDTSIVKITAIIGLVILEAVNLFTSRIDGVILITISGIIAGIGGYEIGRRRGK